MSYTAGLNTKVILFSITKERFLYLSNKFKTHEIFFYQRALATRRLFKKLRIEFEQKEIANKENKTSISYGAYPNGLQKRRSHQMNEISNTSIDIEMMKEKQKVINTINKSSTSKSRK